MKLWYEANVCQGQICHEHSSSNSAHLQDDPELEAIRQRRMQEVMAQQGGKVSASYSRVHLVAKGDESKYQVFLLLCRKAMGVGR